MGALPSGRDQETLVDHPNGRLVHVANEDDNMVMIIDIEKGIRLGQVQVGVAPEGLDISSDGKILVSTSETTNV